MDLKKIEAEEIAFLHLRDASDELLYEDGDKSKPVGVTLFGPGSKTYARAAAAKSFPVGCARST